MAVPLRELRRENRYIEKNNSFNELQGEESGDQK